MNTTSKTKELSNIIKNSKYKIYVGYNLIFHEIFKLF